MRASLKVGKWNLGLRGALNHAVVSESENQRKMMRHAVEKQIDWCCRRAKRAKRVKISP